MQKAVSDGPATIHNAHFSNLDLAQKELAYDTCRRSLFIDRFLPDGTGLNQIMNNSCHEQGDFCCAIYSISKAQTKGEPQVVLERTGVVSDRPIKITKKYLFYPKDNSITVTYELKNLSKATVLLNFAPEINLSLTSDDICKEMGSTSTITLSDDVEKIKIALRLKKPADKVYRYSVRTVSQSEKDIEENYQATCILPVFNLTLKSNKEETIEITLVEGR
jgi:hypothetical protein